MTTIDFNKALQDAKSASFEAMPNGDYNVEIVKADAVTASTGRPMIKCKMKVIDGPFQNRPVMTQFVLSIDNPNALSMFFRNMKAFGLDENFFAQLGTGGQLDPVAGALVGRRAQVTLGTRQWQGEDRNEVTGIKKYTGAPGTVVGTPGAPAMGPIASIPGQVMQQAAQNFNPVTQLPNQLPTPAPVSMPQMPPQAVAQPQAPVAPPQAPPAVQPPVVSTPPVTYTQDMAQQAAEVAQQITQADPGSTAATVSDLIAQQTAEAAETAATNDLQANYVPTAAETAPPAYAQPQVAAVVHGADAPNMSTTMAANEPPQVQQYVDSNAQAMPTPPAPPI